MFDTFGDAVSAVGNAAHGDWEGAVADAVNVAVDCYTCGQGGDIAGAVVEGALNGDSVSDIAQSALRDYAQQYVNNVAA